MRRRSFFRPKKINNTVVHFSLFAKYFGGKNRKCNLVSIVSRSFNNRENHPNSITLHRRPECGRLALFSPFNSHAVEDTIRSSRRTNRFL